MKLWMKVLWEVLKEDYLYILGFLTGVSFLASFIYSATLCTNENGGKPLASCLLFWALALMVGFLTGKWIKYIVKWNKFLDKQMRLK